MTALIFSFSSRLPRCGNAFNLKIPLLVLFCPLIRTTDKQKLTELLDLTVFGASGLAEIQIPRGLNRDSITIPASSGVEHGLRLSVSPEKKEGTITLEPLVIPTQTQVWIRRLDPPQHLGLSLKGAQTELQVGVNGPVQLGLSGGGEEQLDFASPKSFSLQTGPKNVDLEMRLSDSNSVLFPSQLSFTALSLQHIDEFRDPNNTLLRRTSTIESGTLSYTSLNDLERKLRAGEMVHFEQIEGEFRTIRLENGALDLKFHGRVSGMTVGSEQNRRSLMPTWLDWLRARHSLSLLWATALYLFGLISALLRWWGKQELFQSAD